MAKKYKEATEERLLRAFDIANKRVLEDPQLRSSEQSAGFIMPHDLPPGEGYQVFVRVEVFSEARLRKDRSTGGLFR